MKEPTKTLLDIITWESGLLPSDLYAMAESMERNKQEWSYEYRVIGYLRWLARSLEQIYKETTEKYLDKDTASYTGQEGRCPRCGGAWTMGPPWDRLCPECESELAAEQIILGSIEVEVSYNDQPTGDDDDFSGPSEY